MKAIPLYISIVFSITFFACQKSVDVDYPKHSPELVINCYLDSNKPFELYVGHSAHILSTNTTERITNATVSIYDNDVLIEQLAHVGDGKYQGTSSPISGHVYDLVVMANGYPDATSTTSIPPPVAPTVNNASFSDETYYYNTDSTQYEVYRSGNLTFNFQDNAADDNYYFISITDSSGSDYNLQSSSGTIENNGDSTLGNNPPVHDYFFTDEFIQGQTVSIYLGFTIDNSAIYNSDPQSTFGNDLGPLEFQLKSVSREYYLYKKSLDLQRQTSQNFFAEPVHVLDNIEGGFGIFAGASTSVKIIE